LSRACHTAYSYKKTQGIEALIFADISTVAASPLGDLAWSSGKFALQKGADGLVITGKDYEQTLEMLSAVKKAFPQAKAICGGSVTKQNIQVVFSIADGAIVSSSLKSDTDSESWSVEKIKDLVAHARR
jgi:predicted TIM-barrel enzyme